MPEDHEGMGEFHDLFMDDAWETLRPVLARAFASLVPGATVLDLAAGSGVGTRVLAACTAARIIAVEPSRTMRAVLTAGIADDPDLRTRVDIVAEPLPGALDGLASPVSGFVCAHVLGHLSGTDRRATFGRIAELLSPSGTGVVTTASGAEDEQPVVLEESRRIGDLTYVARHLSPDGSTSVSEYEVHQEGRVVRYGRLLSTWEPPADDQPRAEFAAAGLNLELSAAGVGLVRLLADRTSSGHSTC